MLIVDDLMRCEPVLELESIAFSSEAFKKHKPQILIVGTSHWRVDENGKHECLEVKIERLI